jgi:xanthine dehydrogenase YagS FAD-binding subunit
MHPPASLPPATEHGVTRLADGGLRIGAATSVAELARDATVRELAPALAGACDAALVASPRGTLGGNLCQRPCCPWFRRGAPCRKNGRADACPAREADDPHHAVVDGGPCWIVHPSDLAVALVALEATLELASGEATRVVAAADFWVRPAARMDHETVLAPGERVRAGVIPEASLGGHQRYHRRGAPDGWAFVALAVTRRRDREVRLVLGGVAPVPWRVYGSIEEDASVGGLAEDDIETLAERALYDAEPLGRNAHKVALASGLLRDAMREMWMVDA